MNRIRDEVEKVIREAGRMIMGSSPFIVKYKNSKENYTTQTDVEIESVLKRGLMRILPEAHFLGEESDIEHLDKAGHIWIVDPIDGTVNYARSIPLSAISIGLLKNGESVFGMVYNPSVDELYYAAKGEGAFLNGVRITTSDKPFENSLVSLAWSVYNKDWSEPCFAISKVLHRECEDLRRLGSATYELCLLARGSIDLFFEMRLYPWDYAAASVIIREAGGFCQSIDGPLDLLDQCTVLASNNAGNMARLKDVVLSEIGDFRIEGSIWR